MGRLLRISRHRLKSLWQKDELDQQINTELAFHFEQLVSENLAEGMNPAEARQAAQRAMGNLTLLGEQCRDQRRLAWIQDFYSDIVFGLRTLRKSLLFTAVAAISLAIGIGANTAILGAIDGILRGQLPVSDPDTVVLLRTFPLGSPGQQNQASVPDYLAWKERNTVFDSMGAFLADQRDLGGENDGIPPERLIGEGVTPGLFAALRVQPVIGRLFTEEEDQIDNAAPVALISYQLWQRRFGGDPGVLNRQVRMNGAPVTIIGVMPASFRYPLDNLDFWAPMAYNRFQLEGSARLFTVTARLKAGITIQQAQSEMDAIAAQLAKEYPQRHEGWGVRVQSLRTAWFGWLASPLLTLETAVGLLLLIACANVAGLLLARGSVRRPEIAMRVALGATRGRIFRQLLTESVLLSLIGGVLSVAIAYAALRVIATATPPFASQRVLDIGIDARTLALMILISVASGIVFGVAPAMAAVKLDLVSSVTESGRTLGIPRRRYLLSSVLVGTQIALATVLLAGAGLLTRSFLGMVSQDLNFDPQGLLTFEFRVPFGKYLRSVGSNQGKPFFDVAPPTQVMNEVYDRLNALPGVHSAAGISLPPVNSILIPSATILPEGRPVPENPEAQESLHAFHFLVTPNTFATMKAPLVRGREFTARDTAGTPWAAVINESMARRFWPGEDPIGKRFRIHVISGEQPREVIGVIRDIPLSRRAGPEPILYTSYLQQPAVYRGPSGNMFGTLTFMMRTTGDPMNLVPAVKKAIADIDPDRAISRITTMDRLTDVRVRDAQAYVLGMNAFAFVATLLAALGIYGLMSYTVAERTREIGIRMALGAGVFRVLGLVGLRTVLLVIVAIGAGLICSKNLAELLRSQLWGVAPDDPATLAGVSLLLGTVAAMASLIPAQRAVRVDPAEALRNE